MERFACLVDLRLEGLEDALVLYQLHHVTWPQPHTHGLVEGKRQLRPRARQILVDAELLVMVPVDARRDGYQAGEQDACEAIHAVKLGIRSQAAQGWSGDWRANVPVLPPVMTQVCTHPYFRTDDLPEGEVRRDGILEPDVD